MPKVRMVLLVLIVSMILVLLYNLPQKVYASSPGLGLADTFVILSDTYTNTVGGTTLTGDLGYTTGPAVAPTINGDTHAGDATYNQAGIDQGSALSALNSQACTFTFAPGAVDLASNGDFPTSTYAPGVYCIDGAASIGGGGTITLDGAGTYIFRMDGALNTSANSIVAVSGGASACDVWWTPTAATTLGADSTFAGNDIDPSGITIGSNVTWVGRALAFGGTVTTDTDTISAATCISAAPTTTPTTTPTTPGLPDSGRGLSSTQQTVTPVLIVGMIFGVSAIYLIIRKLTYTTLDSKK